MDIWEVLDIAPTKDRGQIREAYFKLVSVYHPEEDPEGFKKLRQAYEEALKQDFVPYNNNLEIVEQEHEDHEYKEHEEAFIEKVNKVYNDFATRRDRNSWLVLLQEDIYMQLDTREEISEELLEYLMDNFYIPTKVWQVFDKHFEWQEQYDRLCEGYPSNFIDFVIASIKGEFALDYMAFDIGQIDYDAFIEAYYKGVTAIRDKEIDIAKEWIEKAEAIYKGHPQQEILEASYLLVTEQLDLAIEVLNQHIERNKNKYNACRKRGKAYLEKGCFLEAYEDYKKVIEQTPTDYKALLGLGESLFGLKNYEEAFEIYKKLKAYYIEDVEVLKKWDAINEYLVEQYSKEITLEYTNEIAYKLARSYYYTNKLEWARKVLKRLEMTEALKPEYNLLGKLYLRLRRVDQAEAYITGALNCEPENPENLQWMGRLLTNQGKYKEAIEYYEKTLEYDPFNMTCRLEAIVLLNRLEEYQEAIKLCNIICKAGILTDQLYWAMGEAYLGNNEVGEAMACFKKASTLNAEAYYNIAEIHVKTQNFNEAIEYYTKALQMQPKEIIILIKRGIVYHELNEIQKAEDDLKQALKINKRSYYVYFRLGMIAKDKKDNARAVKYFNKAIKGNPNDPLPYIYLGELYSDLRENQKCIDIWEKALTLGEGEAQEIYNGLGIVYGRMGQIEKGIMYCDKAIKIEPNRPQYYMTKGNLYRLLGMYTVALICYEQAEKLGQERSNCLAEIGLVYELMDEHQKALKCYEEAIEHCEESAALYYLGNLRKKEKQYKEAVDYYTRAINAAPKKDTDYYLGRGLVYRNQLRLWKAYRDFGWSVRLDKNNKKALKQLFPYHFVLWVIVMVTMFFCWT